MNEAKRWFFGSVDGNWYLVPECLRPVWIQMTRNDPETDEQVNAFESLFGGYRTGGSISGITFTDPFDPSIEDNR